MLSIVFSAIFSLVSLVLFAASMDIPGATDWDVVGSRLVPQVYIIGLGLCSLVVFILSVLRYVRGRDASGKLSLRQVIVSHERIIVVFASLLAWLLAMQVAGFYVSGGLFLLFLCWYLDDRRLSLPVLLTAVTFPVLIYFIFEKGLKVAMPSGMLF